MAKSQTSAKQHENASQDAENGQSGQQSHVANANFMDVDALSDDDVLSIVAVVAPFGPDDKTRFATFLPAQTSLNVGDTLTAEHVAIISAFYATRYASTLRSKADRAKKSDIFDDNGIAKHDKIREDWSTYVTRSATLTEQAAMRWIAARRVEKGLAPVDEDTALTLARAAINDTRFTRAIIDAKRSLLRELATPRVKGTGATKTKTKAIVNVDDALSALA